VNDGKLFLAGEAFPYMWDRRDVGWVHNSAMSGKDAARQIIDCGKKNGKFLQSNLHVSVRNLLKWIRKIFPPKALRTTSC
jgi:hypothetical protein